MDDYSVCLSYMAPDERELWSGAPGAGHLLSASDAVMIPFSIFWCGFACFWEFTAITNGGGFFALFGIPFVAVGFYIMFGRFFHASHMRKKTYYIVTNRRIIRKRGKRVDFLDGRQAQNMQVHAFADGRGTISFNLPVAHGRTTGAPPTGWPMGANFFFLEHVEDVVRVQQIISTMER